MKLPLPILTLCLMFSGSVMAESIPVQTPTSETKVAPKTKKKRGYQRRSAKKRAQPKVEAAAAVAAPAQVVAKAPEVKVEEPKVDTFQAWLLGIKKRLGKSETRSNKLVSVAAVRGDEVSDAAPLYWKGKKGEMKAELPEQKDFESAIGVALTGDKLAAKERLQSFLLAYPTSPLALDAEETLKRLELN